MGMFDCLKAKKNTASIAKDRLRIIIAQERTNRSAPDYLPLLQRELLEVIRKYVSVDVDAVKADAVKDGEHDVPAISVALPEGRPATARPGDRVPPRTCLHNPPLHAAGPLALGFPPAALTPPPPPP